MNLLDFLVGMALGLLLGGLGVYALVKVRGWFSSSEIRRLRQENRQMQKRIEEKNKHIDEMLKRAEEVVRDVQKGRSKGNAS